VKPLLSMHFLHGPIKYRLSGYYYFTDEFTDEFINEARGL